MVLVLWSFLGPLVNSLGLSDEETGLFLLLLLQVIRWRKRFVASGSCWFACE